VTNIQKIITKPVLEFNDDDASSQYNESDPMRSPASTIITISEAASLKPYEDKLDSSESKDSDLESQALTNSTSTIVQVLWIVLCYHVQLEFQNNRLIYIQLYYSTVSFQLYYCITVSFSVSLSHSLISPFFTEAFFFNLPIAY
jgi:hypothetical protein